MPAPNYPGWFVSQLKPGMQVWSDGRRSFYIRTAGRRARVVAYGADGRETEFARIVDAIKAAE